MCHCCLVYRPTFTLHRCVNAGTHTCLRCTLHRCAIAVTCKGLRFTLLRCATAFTCTGLSCTLHRCATAVTCACLGVPLLSHEQAYVVRYLGMPLLSHVQAYAAAAISLIRSFTRFWIIIPPRFAHSVQTPTQNILSQNNRHLIISVTFPRLYLYLLLHTSLQKINIHYTHKYNTSLTVVGSNFV